MADASLAHFLTFSQEQMRAFVDFKEAGSIIFYKYYHPGRHPHWEKACVTTVFMLVAARLWRLTEYNFVVTEDHLGALRDMLDLADGLQMELAKQRSLCGAEVEILCKKFFASLPVFRCAVENCLESNRC